MGKSTVILPVSSKQSSEEIRAGIVKAVGKDLIVMEVCMLGGFSSSNIDALVKDLKDQGDVDVVIVHDRDDRFHTAMSGLATMGHMDSGISGAEMAMIASLKRQKVDIIGVGHNEVNNQKVFEAPPIPIRPYNLGDMLMPTKVEIKKAFDPVPDFLKPRFNKKKGNRPR